MSELFSILFSYANEVWALIAAIVTGIGSFYLGYKRFKREEKQTVEQRLDKFYQEIKAESELLRDENDLLRQRMLEIQKAQTKILIEYTEMKTKWETLIGLEHQDVSIDKLIQFGLNQKHLASTLEEFTTTFPGLLWMKQVEKNSDSTINFRMFALSQKYADIFLNGNRAVYLGKYDKDLWDKDTYDNFRVNDIRAYNSRVPVHVVETIINPVKSVFVGWKWNINVEGIDYVCGYGDLFTANTPEYDFWLNKIEHKPLK